VAAASLDIVSTQRYHPFSYVALDRWSHVPLARATREMDEKTSLEGHGSVSLMSIIFTKMYQATKGLYLVSLDLGNNFIALDMVTFACKQRREDVVDLGRFD
jgi:hypothetical protein